MFLSCNGASKHLYIYSACKSHSVCRSQCTRYRHNTIHKALPDLRLAAVDRWERYLSDYTVFFTFQLAKVCLGHHCHLLEWYERDAEFPMFILYTGCCKSVEKYGVPTLPISSCCACSHRGMCMVRILPIYFGIIALAWRRSMVTRSHVWGVYFLMNRIDKLLHLWNGRSIYWRLSLLFCVILRHLLF